MASAWTARTGADLAVLTADLPSPAPSRSPARRPGRPSPPRRRGQDLPGRHGPAVADLAASPGPTIPGPSGRCSAGASGSPATVRGRGLTPVDAADDVLRTDRPGWHRRRGSTTRFRAAAYRGAMDGIRLVASDLDGTLLLPDETVSERTRAGPGLGQGGRHHGGAGERPPAPQPRPDRRADRGRGHRHLRQRRRWSGTWTPGPWSTPPRWPRSWPPGWSTPCATPSRGCCSRSSWRAGSAASRAGPRT